MFYEPPIPVNNHAHTLRLPFPAAPDIQGSLAAAFNDVKLTPTAFIIDTRGRIVRNLVGELDSESPACDARRGTRETLLMDFKQYFLYQTDYQHWANNALFNALDRLDHDARASAQKMPFENLHNSVDHLAFFYVKWFARLKGEQQTPAYTGTVHADWRELKNDMRLTIRSIQRWLEHQPQEFFDRQLRYRRTLSQAENSIWVRDALTHMYTYAATERGQISAIASTLGAPLPSMAYYTYRREMGSHLENMRRSEADSETREV